MLLSLFSWQVTALQLLGVVCTPSLHLPCLPASPTPPAPGLESAGTAPTLGTEAAASAPPGPFTPQTVQPEPAAAQLPARDLLAARCAGLGGLRFKEVLSAVAGLLQGLESNRELIPVRALRLAAMQVRAVEA